MTHIPDPAPGRGRARVIRRAALIAGVVALFVALTWIVPRLWCGRHARVFFEADRETWTAVADEVALQGVPDPTGFSSGSERFDGEWAFVTCQMTIIGLGQVVRALPGKREQYLPAMRQCARAMQTPGMLSFGTVAWGEEGLSALGGENGHAYLGYLALALGVLREIDPDCPEVAIHDELVDALQRRVDASASGVIETYPGEAYPADVSAVVGAIGLRPGGSGSVRRWSSLARESLVDPGSGLLYQCVDPATAEPRDGPRASGTALATYFLSFADEDISRDLYAALVRGYREPLGLGFGAVREYPQGTHGEGDVDSGPVILGLGASASGFALAGSRIHGDARVHRGIFRTAVLVGRPVRPDGRWRWSTGGALGNAILLAMLTASGPG